MDGAIFKVSSPALPRMHRNCTLGVHIAAAVARCTALQPYTKEAPVHFSSGTVPVKFW